MDYEMLMPVGDKKWPQANVAVTATLSVVCANEAVFTLDVFFFFKALL